MNAWNRVVPMVLAIASTAIATADTRIVQTSHQDSFTVMGHTQPELDTERTLWFGDDRLALAEGDTSFIVRVDEDRLYIIDHVQRTVSHVALPIDVNKLLPRGAVEQMLPVLSLDVVVVPTDETKMVGPWRASRYDVTMTSQMATVTSTVWATRDVEVDWQRFRRLFNAIVSLQPGSDDMLVKLATIDGLTVEEISVTTMRMAADTEMRSHDVTVSVESLDPPPGIYDPPADYTETEFDLLAAMSGN